MERHELGFNNFLNMQSDKEFAKKQMKELYKHSPKLYKLMMSFAFHDITESELLNKQERNLITIALLTSLGATNQLKLHISMGKNNGLSEEKIEEVIIQTIPYTGFHLAWEAIKVLKNN